MPEAPGSSPVENIDEELADTFTAISVVAKMLADKVRNRTKEEDDVKDE